MLTEKQKFIRFLRKSGFKIFLKTHDSIIAKIPEAVLHHRRTIKGDSNIIEYMCCSIPEYKFNQLQPDITPTNQIGNLEFYYQGRLRPNKCRLSNSVQMFKKIVFCRTAKEAKEEYMKWFMFSKNEITMMKIIF